MSLARSWPVAIILTMVAASSYAHNNPTFREDVLLTVEVDNTAGADNSHSKPFALQWPKKTVQLVWEIEGDNADAIRFSVLQQGEEVLTDVASGDRTTRLKGDGIVITNVTGATAPFTMKVLARVLDRSAKPR